MASLADLMVKVGVDSDELTSGIEGAVESVESNLGKIGIGAAAAGGLMEGFARGQGDATAALGRTSTATGETEGSLRELASEMSNHTFAAADAAEGMELLTQKGITTREEFEHILPAVDDLADATGLGLTESIEAADKMLKPFGEDLNDIGENSDQMARLIAQTDVPLGTLERNLGRVPEELQQLGFGLDDAAAGIEHFREEGYTGQEAVREFRGAVADSDGDMQGFLDNLGITAEEWEKYGAAVEPQAGLAEELAEANNSVMTPMEKLQANVENLMFKYGALGEAAGMLAIPLLLLGPALKGILMVVPLLIKGVAGMVTGIAAAATAIWAKIAAMAAWVASMAVTAARVVAGWVLMGAQALIQGARMAAGWVLAMGPVGWITALVIGLVALIVANWDTVVAWTTSAWSAVSSFISSIWNSIVSWISSAVASVVSFVSSAWSTAQSVTSSVFSAIGAFISSIWSGIVAAISGFMSSIMSTISSILSSISATWSSIWSSVSSFLSTTWSNIVSAVTGAMGDLLSSVTGGVGDVLSTVGELPGKILSSLGDLGSLLIDGGKNIVQGLIDGITSMIGNVGSAVTGVVDKVKDFLPWSPAKEGPLRDNPPELGGRNIVDMIAGGMADGESSVVAEAERIAAAAAMDIPEVGGLRVPGAAQVGGRQANGSGEESEGSLIIRIDEMNVREETDIRKISEELDKLRKRDRRGS